MAHCHIAGRKRHRATQGELARVLDEEETVAVMPSEKVRNSHQIFWSKGKNTC